MQETHLSVCTGTLFKLEGGAARDNCETASDGRHHSERLTPHPADPQVTTHLSVVCAALIVLSWCAVRAVGVGIETGGTSRSTKML